MKHPGDSEPRLPELYSYIGYAVFLSQVFEKLLIDAIFVFITIPRYSVDVARMYKAEAIDEWTSFVDTQDGQLRKLPLGKLLKSLKENVQVSPQLLPTLEDAIVTRNKLVHHFFEIHLPSLYHEEGIERAILDARRLGARMQAAIDAFTPIVRQQQAAYGYTDADLQEFVQSSIASAREASLKKLLPSD